jgi:hypothetical protein
MLCKNFTLNIVKGPLYNERKTFINVGGLAQLVERKIPNLKAGRSIRSLLKYFFCLQEIWVFGDLGNLLTVF